MASIRAFETAARSSSAEAVVGDPKSCDGPKWYYQYGSPDGPLETYAFTIVRGRVASISRSGAGCIYNVYEE